MIMNSKYQPLLEELTGGLLKEAALIKVVETVRDIPFQFIGSRDIDSMLEAKVGTCNAKHMLLKELIGGLGYEGRYIVDKFNLSDFLAGLDQGNKQVIELKEIASRLEPYYHTYLQINNGNWVSVDITFDSALAPYGFVVAIGWDGRSDTKLPHNWIETYLVVEGQDPGQLKNRLLTGESTENKLLRKEFFSKLNQYIASLRLNQF